MIKIGHGFDLHRLEDGSSLMLGGVRIEHHKTLVAHSDGDVVLHALIDALLGAAGKGDIGRLFPDNDPQYKNIDSRIMLEHAINLIQPYKISNIDITILAQYPKLAPYIQDMQHIISKDSDCCYVNVKATTTEGVGVIGQEQAIACHAVVLLQD